MDHYRDMPCVFCFFLCGRLGLCILSGLSDRARGGGYSCGSFGVYDKRRGGLFYTGQPAL